MERWMLAAAMLTSGCGTIFSGTTQTVTITAQHRDAEIIVDGRPVGRGSAVPALKRSRTHSVLVQKAGCADGRAVIQQNLNGISLFNILFLIGFGVDAATGALWDLEDDTAVYQDCRPAVTEKQANEARDPGRSGNVLSGRDDVAAGGEQR